MTDSTEDAYVFTAQQLTDARRMMGYAAYGAGNYGFQSYRYFTEYGVLDWRLGNLSQTEGATFVSIYLTQCLAIEQSIFAARANIQVDKAAVYTHNKTEMAELRIEFARMRREMCAFIDIPPGPHLNGGGQPRWAI